MKHPFFCMASLLSVFGLTSTPLVLEAGCCGSSPCRINWCAVFAPELVAAGAAVIGAVAVNKKASRGKLGIEGSTGATGGPGASGATGPDGPVGNAFTHDMQNSLIFNFKLANLQFTGANVSTTIRPFVSTPDGLVRVGNGIFLTTPIVAPQSFSESITIGNPVFGDYNLGLSIDAFPAIGMLSFNRDFFVMPTDGRGTTHYGPTPFTGNGQNFEVELEVNFTYGQIDTVPQ